ncbi:MAG: hypothetical protein JRJ59_11810 [Deltaproteobacteria bacterium]|nr:hypothetical protein [Deltaproteobacteria bacterium]
MTVSQACSGLNQMAQSAIRVLEGSIVIETLEAAQPPQPEATKIYIPTAKGLAAEAMKGLAGLALLDEPGKVRQVGADVICRSGKGRLVNKAV